MQRLDRSLRVEVDLNYRRLLPALGPGLSGICLVQVCISVGRAVFTVQPTVFAQVERRAPCTQDIRGPVITQSDDGSKYTAIFAGAVIGSVQKKNKKNPRHANSYPTIPAPRSRPRVATPRA